MKRGGFSRPFFIAQTRRHRARCSLPDDGIRRIRYARGLRASAPRPCHAALRKLPKRMATTTFHPSARAGMLASDAAPIMRAAGVQEENQFSRAQPRYSNLGQITLQSMTPHSLRYAAHHLQQVSHAIPKVAASRSTSAAIAKVLKTSKRPPQSEEGQVEARNVALGR